MLENQPQRTAAENDDEDHVCEVIFNTDHHRLCKGKLAHVSVLGKLDASLTMKTLTAAQVPRIDAKALIPKLDEISKNVELEVSTILAEQVKIL